MDRHQAQQALSSHCQLRGGWPGYRSLIVRPKLVQPKPMYLVTLPGRWLFFWADPRRLGCTLPVADGADFIELLPRSDEWHLDIDRESPVRKSLYPPILAAAVMACTLGCGSSNIPGGPIIRDANRVEVFRVGSEPADPPAGTAIGGYPILATGKEQGADFAARLSRVLRGGGVTQNRKKCGLQPGVAYRLWSGDKAVEVLVCFKCDVLWPHVVGSQVAAPHHEWQDFDPVRPELLALTKEAFPDDAEIQGLPERRE